MCDIIMHPILSCNVVHGSIHVLPKLFACKCSTTIADSYMFILNVYGLVFILSESCVFTQDPYKICFEMGICTNETHKAPQVEVNTFRIPVCRVFGFLRT